MNHKNIALALAAISVALVPVAAQAGGYFGVTTKGVKHWIPDPKAHNKPWFQKWLEKERKHGREYEFDSHG